MKKMFALFLALILATACSCCFGEAGAETPETEAITEPELTEEVPEELPEASPAPDHITSGDWELAPLENSTAMIVRYTGSDKELDIPEEIDGRQITAVGDRAFEKCTKLRRVSIPVGITEIGANPFMLCSALKEITVAQDHPCFEVRSGVLYGKADRRLICYPCAFEETAFAIPEDVEIIGSMAFCRNESLTGITIPAGVKQIESGAFYECLALEAVTVPDGIAAIPDKAFSGCAGLVSAILPDSVTEIGNWAFFGCTALPEIHIPAGVTAIGYYAFAYCETLDAVTVPEGVKRIATATFQNCGRLKEAVIPAGVEEIGMDAFTGCFKITVFTPADSYTAKYCGYYGIPCEIR